MFDFWGKKKKLTSWGGKGWCVLFFWWAENGEEEIISNLAHQSNSWAFSRNLFYYLSVQES